MKLIKVFNTIHKMSTTHRYSNTHLSERENILEHTGSVVLLCNSMVQEFIKSNDINEEHDNEFDGAGSKILIADVLTKAAIHDVEETVTGDIVRPVKYHSTEMLRLFKELEDRAASKVLTDLSCPELLDSWKSDKDGTSGMFVRVADILCVVYKLYTECVLNGTYSILRACESLITYLEEVQVMIDKQYPISDYPHTNRFFNSLIRDGLDTVSTIQASSPRVASFKNLISD